MKNLKLLLALVFAFTFANARVITTTVSGNDVVIYVPDNASGRLPTFVFVPGLGEQGQNSTVDGLYYNGPLSFIKYNGWTPNYIIIGLRPAQVWPGGAFIDQMLDALVPNTDYHIDENKIYLTGLSAGANCVYSYMNELPNNPTWRKPAAIFPFSFECQFGPNVIWQVTPAWGLCGDKDWYATFYPTMSAYWANMISSDYPNKIWTTMVGYGHGGWNDFYNPEWTQNGKSLYTWATQFPNNTVLDVKFGNFDLVTEGAYTTLTWTTLTETNNSRFEIERSVDGVNFEAVGAVSTKSTNGNSSSTLSYIFKYIF